MNFERNAEKDELLINERWISFNDVVAAIEWWDLMYDNLHPNQNLYPHQYVFIVRINNYPCFVPYVRKEDGTYFLKTLYPSRKYK